jgi:hypothetical protein
MNEFPSDPEHFGDGYIPEQPENIGPDYDSPDSMAPSDFYPGQDKEPDAGDDEARSNGYAISDLTQERVNELFAGQFISSDSTDVGDVPQVIPPEAMVSSETKDNFLTAVARHAIEGKVYKLKDGSDVHVAHLEYEPRDGEKGFMNVRYLARPPEVSGDVFGLSVCAKPMNSFLKRGYAEDVNYVMTRTPDGTLEIEAFRRMVNSSDAVLSLLGSDDERAEIRQRAIDEHKRMAPQEQELGLTLVSEDEIQEVLRNLQNATKRQWGRWGR